MTNVQNPPGSDLLFRTNRFAIPDEFWCVESFHADCSGLRYFYIYNPIIRRDFKKSMVGFTEL